MSDIKHLVKALRQVGAKPYQVKMAATLLAVNGIENALEFVFGLQTRGLTLVAANADAASKSGGGGWMGTGGGRHDAHHSNTIHS